MDDSILLAGGAGYIGTHVAIELLSAGYGVVLADNFSNSSPDVIGRLEQIAGREIPVYAVDVRSRDQLAPVFARHRIGAVMHFAGFKSVAESVAEPLRYYRNNIDATLTLLEAMKDCGVKRFVFSSSATVYGVPQAVPVTEDAPTGSCFSPYGRCKYFCEQILRDAAEADPELSVILLRYFNPLGAHESGLIGELPREIPNNLLPYLTQTAMGLRRELKVYGDDYPTRDGTGVRDYIHVTDLAKGHVAALRYGEGQRGAEAFNLGTGIGHSVLEVVAAFEKATGVRIPYVIAPRRPGDIAEYYASPEKAQRLLGWKAEKTLEDMCRDAWRWQQFLSGWEGREKG